MVSFWPFGHDDGSSPKTFEKALATLSAKIQRLQTRDDTLRATHRRVKVLFTLYASFVYILVFLILTLVTGYEKWHQTEWTAIAGSPVAILVTRYLLDTYFDWRENNVKTRLDKAVQERDKVIKKLKEAMRYDSTKELLDKYGGMEGGKGTAIPGRTPPKLRNPGRPNQKPSSAQQQQQQRTNFNPPPTANIPGRNPPPQNAIDARLRNAEAEQQKRLSTTQSPPPSASHSRATSESFAPNAFPTPPQSPDSAQYPLSGHFSSKQPSFLDRILDLIVGEDESAPKNRFALICSSCRLVNGQAPPGTRSLEELGRWRCGSCGAWNGIEAEVGKALKKSNTTGARGGDAANSPDRRSGFRSSVISVASTATGNDVGREHAEEDPPHSEEAKAADKTEHDHRRVEVDEEDDDDDDEEEATPAGSTRSKARQKQQA